MSPRKTVFVVAAATVVLVSVPQYRSRLSRQDEAARLREANAQMRLQASQRRESDRRGAPPARAREPGATRARADERPRTSDSPTAGARAFAEGVSSRAQHGNYRNEGQGTPLEALQTLAWACDRGDAATMAQLLSFDLGARRKAEVFFDSMPKEVRHQWASLDAMTVSVYLADGIRHPYPAAEMLQAARFEPVTDGRVVVRLPGANGDGYVFQRDDGVWKLAITEQVVDEYIRESARTMEGS